MCCYTSLLQASKATAMRTVQQPLNPRLEELLLYPILPRLLLTPASSPSGGAGVERPKKPSAFGLQETAWFTVRARLSLTFFPFFFLSFS